MRWLTNLFKPKPPPPPIEHHSLGQLIGSRALNGQVCRRETVEPVATSIGQLKVEFEAGSDGPEEPQLFLWLRISGDLESAAI
jgi:hypothetical protein